MPTKEDFFRFSRIAGLACMFAAIIHAVVFGYHAMLGQSTRNNVQSMMLFSAMGLMIGTPGFWSRLRQARVMSSKRN